MNKLLFLLFTFVSTFTYAHALNNEPFNEDYLASVQETATPEEVLESQTMVSEFDVTRAEGFEGINAPFNTVFKFNKGTISATYDQEGQLISSIEDFTDVQLPVEVRNEIFNQFGEGWEMVQNRYSVHYFKGKETEVFYTIKLDNGEETQRILVDADLNVTKA